ncbi:hypothetical protein D3C76_712490 [compost metagenome]
MRFLDLVEQNHTVGLAADTLCQLTAFVISHITGWRADQTSNRMPLHVLRHINTNDRLLVTKHRFRQRFGKFSFANARRAKKEKRGNRSVRLTKAGSRQTNGIADREYSVFLSNQPLTQRVFHIQQLLTLFLRKLGHRNTGETGQHLGN